MPKRSSKDLADPNVTAFNIVRQATDEHRTGQNRLAALIREVAGGLDAGETPEALAERLWPAFRDTVMSTGAAQLGSKGGKKGGKARADKLSPERRREIARGAAAARWNKPRPDK